MAESVGLVGYKRSSETPSSCSQQEGGYLQHDKRIAGSVGQQRGNEYLESIPVDQRRRVGQVYTPLYLAEFILDRAGYGWHSSIEGRMLLDPACGAGVFLVAAVRILVARLQSQGVDLSSNAGRALVLRRVTQNLYGVDTDATACELTRASVRDEVSRLIGAPVPRLFFQTNVVRSDFLLSFRNNRLRRRRRSGIDFVVGNPPYVSTTRITPAYKERLRRRFQTASGRLDLYTLFIERSLALLNRGGRLAFITPNKFLVSVTSRPLRALLLGEGAVHTIVNFRSHRVFEGAATVPCILVFERGGTARSVSILECHDRHHSDGTLRIIAHGKIDRDRLGEGPWHLTGTHRSRLIEAIRGQHPTLATLTSRISAGTATGCDGVYVLPRTLAAEIEPELRRPAVRGRDLAPYKITDPELEIIVPYSYNHPGHPRIVELSRYPRAYAHLVRHRRHLENRHCCRVWDKPWYDLHDPVPFDLAAQPKILVPDIARSNRFVFDPGQYYPLHSAYYLIPRGVDPTFLTAVLNSRPLEFLVRLLAPLVKDGFSRYRRQFLLELPVPIASPTERRDVIKALETGDRAGLEEMVAELFGLPKGDLDAVNGFLLDLDEQSRNRSRMVSR